MALITGYGAKAGVAKEGASTWGTLGTPVAEQIPILNESFDEIATFAEQETLVSKVGREVSEIITKDTNGALQLEARYQECDLIWALLFGGTTGISGGPPDYTHTIALAEEIARSLSLYIEKGVNVWNIAGMKIDTLTLTSSPATSPATLDLGVSAKAVTRNTTERVALAALSYAGAPRLMFDDLTVRMNNIAGALASPADDQKISELSVVFNNNLQLDGRCTDSGVYIQEQLRNAFRDIMVNLTFTRVTVDTLFGYRDAGTPVQIDIVFTTTVGSIAYTWKLELPTLLIKEVSAPIGDASITPASVVLQAYKNDGNTYMSTITDECKLTIINGRTPAIWV